MGERKLKKKKGAKVENRMVQVVQAIAKQTVCNVNHIMVVRGKKPCM